MARLPRNFVPGLPQHVVQRGNNRQAIFVGDDDRYRYLDCLAEASSRHGCAIHAYVLMTNHVHLLLTPGQCDAVSRTMQSIGRRYVRYFNGRQARSGTLWQGRFKAALVGSERYFLTCMRYIELNPVRAAMTNRPEEYHWSSHRSNAFGAPCALLTEHDVYAKLGSNRRDCQSAYRALFSHAMADDELAALRRATERGEPLGDETFIANATKVLGRRVTKQAHGGDRKSFDFMTHAASNTLTP